MGCFDYCCECKGKSCDHTGGQTNPSVAYIEVPLSDGSNVYLKGFYDQYGYVAVKSVSSNIEYHFYLTEFEEYFESWFNRDFDESISRIFIANKVWTAEETIWGEDDYHEEAERHVTRLCFDRRNVPTVELTADILSKCIRADKGLNVLSYEEKKKIRLERYQNQYQFHKTHMEFFQKKITELTKECP